MNDTLTAGRSAKDDSLIRAAFRRGDTLTRVVAGQLQTAVRNGNEVVADHLRFHLKQWHNRNPAA